MSVDIVSTSETDISFTVDCQSAEHKKTIATMVTDLREELQLADRATHTIEFVEATENKALLFCIGQNMLHHTNILARACHVLD